MIFQAEPEKIPEFDAATDSPEFQTLLEKIFTSEQAEGLPVQVKLFLDQVRKKPHLIREDASETLEAAIADLDRQITAQTNVVLHHADFQELEAAWRGLEHLRTRMELGENLKLMILDVNKVELGQDLKPGTTFTQSETYKKVSHRYDVPGEYPFGCIVGDFYFDNTKQDLTLLEGMAKVASAAHAPFIAAAAPGLLGFKSWLELPNPTSIGTRFQTSQYADWNAIRDSADSSFLGLTLPRFLARDPYSAKTINAYPGQYVFEEDVDGQDHSKYLWANAAYAMAGNIARAFAVHGWCVQIRGDESGGKVDGLPCHHFTTQEGDVDMKCPTEVRFKSSRERELAEAGLIALSHTANQSSAVFYSAQSVQKPRTYDDRNTSGNAVLTARLPYIFASSRFAHYLKGILLKKVGSFKEKDELKADLNKWLKQYVCENRTTASQADLAAQPLAAASVELNEIKGSPGAYDAVFQLRPHYQLESVNVSLQLVTRLRKDSGS